MFVGVLAKVWLVLISSTAAHTDVQLITHNVYAHAAAAAAAGS
jgi:hypothetical protein